MSDFDEYVAARGPALLALGVLVAGDEAAGQRLVGDVLARALPHWDELVHDEDPDLHLRRELVVHAARLRPPRGLTPADGSDTPHEQVWRAWCRLAPRTRALLALHVAEERPVGEVAWLAGIGERAAQQRIERGLADLGRWAPVLGQRPTEPDGLLRATLGARREAVRAWPGDLRDRADRLSRSRRARRLGWAGAALAVAVVAVPLAASTLPGLTPRDLQIGPDDGTTLQTVLPEGWRTETWRGLEIGVPGDWGHGSLTGWCADGSTSAGETPAPRVDRPGGAGRPGRGADCDPGLAPGVQFRLAGDPAPEVPEGLAAGERTLDGDVVLVATPDEELTERVLATVRLVERTDSAGCDVQRAVPRAGKNFPVPDEGRTTLAVCRYEVGISGSNLVQSERLSVMESLEAVEALEAAPTVRAPQGCLDGPGEEVVLLATDDADRAWIHLGRCQGFDDDGTHLLTPEVLYWALSPGWEGERGFLPLPRQLRAVDQPG